MAYKTLRLIYRIITNVFIIGFVILLLLSAFMFFLFPIAIVLLLVCTAIIYGLEVVLAKLALAEIRLDCCPKCSVRSQIQLKDAGYYLCHSCNARFKENGKEWKKKKRDDTSGANDTPVEEAADTFGESLAKGIAEDLEMFTTPPDTNPTKQREDAVPCKVCGKPTWSESAICILCSVDIKDNTE